MHMIVGYQPGDTAARDAMTNLLDRIWISVWDPQSVDYLRRNFIEEMTSVRRLLGMPPPEPFPEIADPSEEHVGAHNTWMTTTAPHTPHTCNRSIWICGMSICLCVRSIWICARSIWICARSLDFA